MQAHSLRPSHASVIFQPFSSLSPAQPAKPFRMSHESHDFLAMGHLSFAIKRVTKYTARGEAFLSPHSIKATSEGACGMAVIHLWFASV